MIIVLNGPLGIGKSTLAEALVESVQQCVMLNGDGMKQESESVIRSFRPRTSPR